MTDYDEGGEFDGMQDEPRYLLLAREAEMFKEGGFSLTADPQKAGLAYPVIVFYIGMEMLMVVFVSSPLMSSPCR